jgi:hypothetical protein
MGVSIQQLWFSPADHRYGMPSAFSVPYLIAAIEFAFGCWFVAKEK